MPRSFVKFVTFLSEPFVILILVVLAIAARFKAKKVDVGLGPLPLVNNIYHKKVFQNCGYTAETFVNQVWHITSNFDVRADIHPLVKIPKIGRRLNALRFAAFVLFRYRCVVIYFNGCVLGVSNTFLLWRVEPFILSLAKVKTLVLAYGADVQDMSRSQNLLFKDAMSKDYPLHKRTRKRIADKIDLWTSYGDHVVGGCEWVDYMHHWDTLMISHFSIDESEWKINPDLSARSLVPRKTFSVLHAPNHRAIKGTAHVIQAVEELKKEGCDIELILVEKRPNHEIRELIRSCDVVVDQLIVGWYAMFAIEAMALEKPVVCYHRQDLEDLYRASNLYMPDEKIPLIQATPLTIKKTLRTLYQDRDEIVNIGMRGRNYVLRHHSIGAIANVFGPIAKGLIGQPLLLK
ncbi:hypothetical protein [Micavibrio aeruginosavorus]|uniref:hypothetical protein n=1 Tax=Micavibrio aeruginosavorus TaxID=349221 RepID=UPI003F4A96AC